MLNAAADKYVASAAVNNQRGCSCSFRIQIVLPTARGHCQRHAMLLISGAGGGMHKWERWEADLRIKSVLFKFFSLKPVCRRHVCFF